MQRIQYAVVKDKPDEYGKQKYTFTKFHIDEKLAQDEAERLSRQEKCRFLVLKLVGYCEPDILPIKKVFWQ